MDCGLWIATLGSTTPKIQAALPNPPLREGVGETRFPHVPTAVGSGWRPHRWGCGSTGSPQVGKPGFPVWSPQAPFARRTTPACNHGRATPSLALPRWGREPGSSPQGGGWGNPVSPCPNRWWGRLAPQPAGGWGNPVSPYGHLREGDGETRFPHIPDRRWERLAPHRWGCGSTGSPQVGKPGFPVWSPQGGGWGNPVSPYVHIRTGSRACGQGSGREG